MVWPITARPFALLRDENGRRARGASQRKVRRVDFLVNKESRHDSYLLLQPRVLRLGLFQDRDVGVASQSEC